jgi:DNA polymerase III subunit beta
MEGMMIFEIEKSTFLDALTRTVPIAEKRTTLPILSHVLLDARDNQLVLTATDLEVGLRIACTCVVHEPGSLAVPSRKLFEIVRELPVGTMSIRETVSGRIEITSKACAFELAGLDAADYPSWISGNVTGAWAIRPEKLLYMIDKTLFASSSDDSRYNLNSVLFEQDEGRIRLVATDGHRLALMSDDLGLSLQSKILVPRKGLTELKRILDGIKDELSVGFEEKNLVVKTPQMMASVRLIDGEFPDYRKVIPPGGDTIMKASRSAIIQTLRRVAVLSSDRNKGVNVSVRPNEIEISIQHPELGTARDVVDVDYSGEEFSIIVNVLYFIEALGVIDSDEVLLEFIKDGGPIILRPDPAKEYFNLVMPMRK